MSDAHREEISLTEYHGRKAGPWISHSATRYAYKIMPDKEWVWTPHTFKRYLEGKMRTYSTKDQDVGTIFHCLCEGTDPNILVCPVYRRGTKEWNAWVAKEAAKRNMTAAQLETEFTILKSSEDDKILQMFEMMKKNKIVCEMMEDKKVAKEGTVRWIDKYTKLPLQARPDLETENFVLDYKTSTSPEDFLFSAYDMGYHRQSFLQVAGVEAVTGKKKTMRHIVVGKSAPFDVIVYELPPNAMALGEAEVRMICSNIRDWIDFDMWESPWDSKIVRTDFPSYIYRGMSL